MDSLVSIITPTYMRDETLLRAARSVMEQTHRPIEHIIVGDRCPKLGSLEGELRAINPKIAILHLPDWRATIAHYTTARIARARNAGIVAASGDYVCQLDSDNTIDSDHVASLLGATRKSPCLAGAVCGRKLFFPDGRPYDLPYHPWADSVDEAAETWRNFARLGVYVPGTNLANERLSFAGTFFGVDANEILLKRDVHLRYLFPTSFTTEQIEGGLGEDELLSARLFGDGVPIGHTGRCTLNFFLGGAFTVSLAEQLAKLKGSSFSAT